MCLGKRTCMNFVRSQANVDLDCQPGPLQQINQVTHWLDGSGIYGSTGNRNIPIVCKHLNIILYQKFLLFHCQMKKLSHLEVLRMA